MKSGLYADYYTLAKPHVGCVVIIFHHNSIPFLHKHACTHAHTHTCTLKLPMKLCSCIAILPVTMDKLHFEPHFCWADYKCSLSDDKKSPPRTGGYLKISSGKNVMKTFILLSIRNLATIHSVEHPCLTLMICGCTGRYHRKRSSCC